MTPKNIHKIFIPPKNIYFSENPPKNWNSKFWTPEKWHEPTYVWKYQSTPPPPPPPGLSSWFGLFSAVSSYDAAKADLALE